MRFDGQQEGVPTALGSDKPERRVRCRLGGVVKLIVFRLDLGVRFNAFNHYLGAGVLDRAIVAPSSGRPYLTALRSPGPSTTTSEARGILPPHRTRFG